MAAPSGDAWWETSHLYNGTNYNKRDLTLDLKNDRGMALFKELISKCDVLIENFAPRVFENYGLSWEEIKKINPNIVFVRMPAFGLDGPWRDKVGFAQTIEQMSGLAWLTGHKEDQPRVQRHQPFMTEAETIDHAGAETFQEHVRVGDQCIDNAARLLAL